MEQVVARIIVWPIIVSSVIGVFLWYRSDWYFRQWMKWIGMAQAYNFAMIEWCIANDRPFSIGPVVNQNLGNYNALGKYGTGMWNLTVWKLEGLAVDKIAYRTVATWYEKHLQELQ